MFERCAGCGGTENFRFWRADVHNNCTVLCRDCHSGKNPMIRDIYYGYGSGTHSEDNIAYPKGHEKAGQPIPFSSREGKWQAMQIAGVREAGDRRHGSR